MYAIRSYYEIRNVVSVDVFEEQMNARHPGVVQGVVERVADEIGQLPQVGVGCLFQRNNFV